MYHLLGLISTSLFICILCVILFLNFLGLPANWIILGLVFIWTWLYPGCAELGWTNWIILGGLALLGEIVETGLQLRGSKKHGSSKTGTWGGILGAVLLSIFMAPLFMGFGAVIGAFAGAWLGCFIFELIKKRPLEEAKKAAFGTLHGKFLGTICKCGLGALIIAWSAHQIWPERSMGMFFYNGYSVIKFISNPALCSMDMFLYQ